MASSSSGSSDSIDPLSQSLSESSLTGSGGLVRSSGVDMVKSSAAVGLAAEVVDEGPTVSLDGPGRVGERLPVAAGELSRDISSVSLLVVGMTIKL